MTSLPTAWEPPTPQLLKLITIDGVSRSGELKSKLALLAGAKASLTILENIEKRKKTTAVCLKMSFIGYII
jgi:hypothetical protein